MSPFILHAWFAGALTSLPNDDVTGTPEVGPGDWSGSRSTMQDNSGMVLCGDGREPASPSRKCCENDITPRTRTRAAADVTFDTEAGHMSTQ